jgi:hypothetical protein
MSARFYRQNWIEEIETTAKISHGNGFCQAKRSKNETTCQALQETAFQATGML